MNESIHLAAAGNMLAAALAVLRRMGYVVSRAGDGYRAVNPERQLLADDPLELLGLVALLDERGACWQPTDEEVDALMQLECDGVDRGQPPA